MRLILEVKETWAVGKQMRRCEDEKGSRAKEQISMLMPEVREVNRLGRCLTAGSWF
jgi:hypothetical protein